MMKMLLFWAAVWFSFKIVNCRDEIIGQIYYKTELGLTMVPPDIPNSMGQVHLEYNSITILKTDSFLNLTQCTLLTLNHNKIRTIEQGAFNGLNSLDTLNLYENNMKILEEGMFSGMPALRMLNVAGNGVTTINTGCFRGMSTLEELHLTSHSMTTISGDMWIGLESVSHLDLQHSPSMTTIPPGGLSNLPKLDLLHLHNNALKTLTKAMFNAAEFPNSNGHPALLRLTLAGNPLMCDAALCWVKQAEKEGWLKWRSYSGTYYGPSCANNVDWDSWNCSSPRCPGFQFDACRSRCLESNHIVVPDAVDENQCVVCKCKATGSQESESDNNSSTLALVAVFSVIAVIVIAAVVILICLKRNGVKLCHVPSDSPVDASTKSTRQEIRNSNNDYDYVDEQVVNVAVPAHVNPGYCNESPPPEYLSVVPGEGPHQYQPLKKI